MFEILRKRAGSTGTILVPSTSSHHSAAVGRIPEHSSVLIGGIPTELGKDHETPPNDPASNFRKLAARTTVPTSIIYTAAAKGAKNGTEKVLKTTTFSPPSTARASIARLPITLGVIKGSEPSSKLDPSRADNGATSDVTG